MTVTKAQYDKLMAIRTRPLTDPYMDVSRSERERMEARGINLTDDTADVLEQMIRARINRGTKDAPITVGKNLKLVPVACGTEQGYQRHKHRIDGYCDPCQAAHRDHARTKRATPRPPKDAA